MSVLKRMKAFFAHLFKSETSEQDVLQEQQEQQKKLKNALVNLIFQRKQTEGQLTRVEQQLKELEQDLNQAAQEDRDDLAIYLMQQLESTQAEFDFLKSHHGKIVEDIEVARKTELELGQKMQMTRRQLSSMRQKRHILQARQSVHQQLSTGMNQDNALQRIEDKITRLEAENEALENTQPWHKDLEKMRGQRKGRKYQSQLQQLKQSLNQKQLTFSGRLQPSH